MITQQQELTNPCFNSKRFLEIRQLAFRYFMSERLNFGVNPTVMDLQEYISYYVDSHEMPTIATMSRWHSCWKRSK